MAETPESNETALKIMANSHKSITAERNRLRALNAELLAALKELAATDFEDASAYRFNLLRIVARAEQS